MKWPIRVIQYRRTQQGMAYSLRNQCKSRQSLHVSTEEAMRATFCRDKKNAKVNHAQENDASVKITATKKNSGSCRIEILLGFS